MRTPSVSVFLFCEADSGGLPVALRSIICQDYVPKEVVVFGKDLDTIDWLDEFSGTIKVAPVSVSSVSDLGAQVEQAMFACDEDYIALLCDQDIWHPEKLSIQLALAESHPDVALFTCQEQWIDNAGEPMAPRTARFLGPRMHFGTSSVLLRRSAVTSSAGEHGKPDFLLRFIESDELAIVHRTLVACRSGRHQRPLEGRWAGQGARYSQWLWRIHQHLAGCTDGRHTWQDTDLIQDKIHPPVELAPQQSLNVPEQLVTIVVPAYNAEKTVRETLASLLAQTHLSLQIIVVDDGSSDRTAAILMDEYERLPEVSVIILGVNAGVCVARNTGIRAAISEYVMCVDADDLLHPDSVTSLLTALVAKPEAAMAYGAKIIMNEGGLIDLEGTPPSITMPRPTHFQGFLMGNLVGHGSGVLFRKSLAETIDFFNEDLRNDGGEGCADWLFYLDLSHLGTVLAVPVLTVVYRISPQSMSSNPEKMIQSHAKVMAQALLYKPDLDRTLIACCNARFQSMFIGRWVRNKQYATAACAWFRLCRRDTDRALTLLNYPLKRLSFAMLRRIGKLFFKEPVRTEKFARADISLALQRQHVGSSSKTFTNFHS